jgi:hypothetical protein
MEAKVKYISDKSLGIATDLGGRLPMLGALATPVGYA